MPLFKDRIEAAQKLLPLLEKYRNQPAVVLAIPKGSVPMAYWIASRLELPLDLMMCKKICFYGNPEFTIGSVSLVGRLLALDKEVDEEYLNEETYHLQEALLDQYQRFMGTNAPILLSDKTVILIDDGIATGFTMLEAVETVREQNPRKIVVAVPFGPSDRIRFLQTQVDEVICLAAPAEIQTLNQCYEDFASISDQEVAYWMKKSRQIEYPKP